MSARSAAGAVGGMLFMDANDLFIYGLKQLRSGSWQDAFSAFRLVIDLQPTFAEAYTYSCIAQYQLGNHDAAMQDYDESIEMWPNIPEAYLFRGILYGHRSEHAKAISLSRSS